MSLNFNLTKIENYNTLCWLPEDPAKPDVREKMNPVTEALIYSLMDIDIGEITSKNLKEVLIRLRVRSKVSGRPLSKVEEVDGKEEIVSRDFTIDEIKSHIGLETNVSTKSYAYFQRRLVEWMRRDAEYSVNSELRAMEEKAEVAK